MYLNFLTCPNLQDLELAVFSTQGLEQEDRTNQAPILTDFLNEHLRRNLVGGSGGMNPREMFGILTP